MTKDKQGTPASDPARLCAAASNMDIAMGMACAQSANGRTVLIWTDVMPAAMTGPGSLIPRYQEGGEKPPADLKYIVAGFENGVEMRDHELLEWNRRLVWTDSQKRRDRYKPASDTNSESKKPDAP